MKKVSKALLTVVALLLVGAIATSASASDVIRIVVNGKNVSSDVPPQITNGRVLVPLRALSEALGATANWDSDSQTVTVSQQSQAQVASSSLSTDKLIFYDDVRNNLSLWETINNYIVELQGYIGDYYYSNGNSDGQLIITDINGINNLINDDHDFSNECAGYGYDYSKIEVAKTNMKAVFTGLTTVYNGIVPDNINHNAADQTFNTLLSTTGNTLTSSLSTLSSYDEYIDTQYRNYVNPS
jgi:hypothetical protein